MNHSFFRLPIALALLFTAAALPLAAQEPAGTPPPPAKPRNIARQPAIDPHLLDFGGTRFIAQVPPVEAIATVTPFLFATLIVGIVAFARYRRSQVLHETLRTMVEKGVSIPPELLVPSRPARSDFRRGVLLTAGGAALIACLGMLAHRAVWSVGLVPVALGLGYLLVARFGKPPTADTVLPPRRE